MSKMVVCNRCGTVRYQIIDNGNEVVEYVGLCADCTTAREREMRAAGDDREVAAR